jgi:hypothetical protein
MEEFAEFASPGNTRTPIQAVRNEMNAIRASQAAREAAGAAGGGGGEVVGILPAMPTAYRQRHEALVAQYGPIVDRLEGRKHLKVAEQRELEAAKTKLKMARTALAADNAADNAAGGPRARQNTSRLSNLRVRLSNLEKNKTRKNLRNSSGLHYIVISGVILDVFESKVMEKIGEGYILQGGVSKTGSEYNQALVKHKESRNLLANNANLLVL